MQRPIPFFVSQLSVCAASRLVRTLTRRRSGRDLAFISTCRARHDASTVLEKRSSPAPATVSVVLTPLPHRRPRFTKSDGLPLATPHRDGRTELSDGTDQIPVGTREVCVIGAVAGISMPRRRTVHRPHGTQVCLDLAPTRQIERALSFSSMLQALQRCTALRRSAQCEVQMRNTSKTACCGGHGVCARYVSGCLEQEVKFGSSVKLSRNRRGTPALVWFPWPGRTRLSSGVTHSRIANRFGSTIFAHCYRPSPVQRSMWCPVHSAYRCRKTGAA